MPRHAHAVMLLGGWLLMFPPLTLDKGGKTTGVRMSAPIEEWGQESAHDTAEACEEAKWENAKQLVDLMKKAGKDTTKDQPLINQATLARCVPADHIYPPKGPARPKTP